MTSLFDVELNADELNLVCKVLQEYWAQIETDEEVKALHDKLMLLRDGEVKRG